MLDYYLTILMIMSQWYLYMYRLLYFLTVQRWAIGSLSNAVKHSSK